MSKQTALTALFNQAGIPKAVRLSIRASLAADSVPGWGEDDLAAALMRWRDKRVRVVAVQVRRELISSYSRLHGVPSPDVPFERTPAAAEARQRQIDNVGLPDVQPSPMYPEPEQYKLWSQ